VFAEAGEGPALDVKTDEALDLLSLLHNQFHFWENYTKGGWTNTVQPKIFLQGGFCHTGVFLER
jgi:hypothetical protein